MYAVPFEAGHVGALGFDSVPADAARALEGAYAVTLMADGKPILAAGVIPMWEDRGFLWAFMSPAADRRVFRALHTFAKMFVANLPFRRLEAAVEVGFEAGHRWVRSLGFVCEAPLARSFRADGKDCALYALVKEI